MREILVLRSPAASICCFWTVMTRWIRITSMRYRVLFKATIRPWFAAGADTSTQRGTSSNSVCRRSQGQAGNTLMGSSSPERLRCAVMCLTRLAAIERGSRRINIRNSACDCCRTVSRRGLGSVACNELWYVDTSTAETVFAGTSKQCTRVAYSYLESTSRYSQTTAAHMQFGLIQLVVAPPSCTATTKLAAGLLARSKQIHDAQKLSPDFCCPPVL